jgi:branched-chain amino acid transport system substrate-binding protein
VGSRRCKRSGAALAALVLMLAACGDDDDADDTAATADTTDATVADTPPDTTLATAVDETDATIADTTVAPDDTTAPGTETTVESTETGEAADPLGTPDPASGEPVKVGLITEEGGAGGGSQGAQTSVAYEIAVQYLNEYQGGIGGRPIEIWECGNSSTPAGAQDCAQQAVEQNVVAVVVPFDCCGDDQVPIVTGAGIPYVVASGSANSHLTTPGAFSLSGGYVATLGGVAKHAADQGFTKVTHIVIDVPSATGAATNIGGLVFGNAGVEYEVVPVAPGTPDMTPQLSAAGDSAVMVTGDITFCTSFNQAYETLGLTNPKYQIATCIDPGVVESIPSAFDGSFLPTSVSNEGADAELFAAIVTKYGDDIDPDPLRSGTIATPLSHLINFARFLEGLEGEITAATVMEQMRTATDVPLFLGSGATATCDGTAIPILPNVCSTGVLMATLDANAVPTEVAAVDLTGLYDA